MSTDAPRPDALRRDIGPLGAAMLALNGMIGAGVFALPAALAADFGGFSPWLFLIFGGLIFLIAVPLAELAALTPATGGPIIAVRQAFGQFAAFEVAAAYTVARIAALAANAVVFADYAARLFPATVEGPTRIAVILLLIAAATAANVTGVRRASAAINVASALKTLPLIALGVAALSAAKDLPPSAPPPLQELQSAALLVLYAFIGFEAILMPAGETRRAASVIPRMMLTALGGVALFYFIVVAGYVAVMGGEDAPTAPLAALGERLFGPLGGAVILCVALVSIAGNFMSNLLSTPRVAFALAEEGLLPRWFGRVSRRFQTPANAILFMGAAAAALAVTGAFVELAVISTLARLLVYAVSIAALPVLKRRGGTLKFSGRSAAAALVPAAGLCFCLWAIAQSTLAAFQTLGLLLIAGSALYLLARRTTQR